MTRLVIIADSHNKHNKINLPEGDILIHCGDFSGQGYHNEIRRFLNWYAKQPHTYKLLIAGNHDICLEPDADPEFKQWFLDKCKRDNIIYLEDNGVDIEGIKFYGFPHTPEFNNWAFNLPRGGQELFEKANDIPLNTDVLITHGPPKGILDRSMHVHPKYPQDTGCQWLLEALYRVNPAIHCFGHLHECYGADYYSLPNTVCINASICNLNYQPSNLPIILDIDPKTKEVSFVDKE